jgi:DNA-binding transcriptional LysR family regulator
VLSGGSSQPALTKQIKQLESLLGVRLFTRSRAGMAVTAAGHALADSTPAVLAGWDQALRETRAAASRTARVLRVGFMSSAANGYGIALTSESAARYHARPGITYRPVTGVSPSQVGVAWPPRQRRRSGRPGLRPLLPGQQAAHTPTAGPAVTAGAEGRR